MQEFQVVNSGLSAESGGASGGSINVITRSGTNMVHGDAFIFAQDGAFNARDPFENQPNKPAFRRFRAGFALGGPVVRDKTFYYAAVEQEHNRGQIGTDIDSTVASTISVFLATGAVPGIATRQITTALAPVARAETEAAGKVDHQVTKNTGLMLRYSFTNNKESGDAFNVNSLIDASARGSAFTSDNGLSGSLTTVLGAKAVSDLRFQVASRHAVLRTNEVSGPEIDIAVDFHAKTSPSVASILVKEVEPLNLLFIEEPCPPENVQAMAKIARRSTTPIATGERLIASYGCRELIEMGVIDILQTDINHVGGISGLWKVAATAAVSGISMAPHACEGPIGGLATIHVDAAMPNFVVQEICGQVKPNAADKVWEEWFGFPAMRMVNGRFPLSEKPGLGFELSEASLAKFPFGGTRPMARVFHEDGSVAEW